MYTCVCMFNNDYVFVCMCACACVLQSTASANEKKSRKMAFVTFIDYGSVDSIPLEQLLPLDQVRVMKLYGYLSSRCFET